MRVNNVLPDSIFLCLGIPVPYNVVFTHTFKKKAPFSPMPVPYIHLSRILSQGRILICRILGIVTILPDTTMQIAKKHRRKRRRKDNKE